MRRPPGGSLPATLRRRSAGRDADSHAPTTDEQVALAVTALHRIAAALRSTPAGRATYRPPRETAVLQFIYARGEQTVGELAASTGLTLPAASLAAIELSRAGLVDRREDPGDRRRTLVAIAPQAATEVAALLEPRRAAVRRALDLSPAGAREEVIRGLTRLAGEMGRGAG